MLPATFSASFWSASVSIQSSRGTHSAVYPFAAWPRVVTVARRSMAISSPSCGIPSMAVAGWQLGALSNHWCFSWHCSQSLVFLSYLLKRCSGLARLFLPFFYVLSSSVSYFFITLSLSLFISQSFNRSLLRYLCLPSSSYVTLPWPSAPYSQPQMEMTEYEKKEKRKEKSHHLYPTGHLLACLYQRQFYLFFFLQLKSLLQIHRHLINGSSWSLLKVLLDTCGG